MTFFGMLRVKNESRWIRHVLDSMIPLCERIFILDDHSTDCTAQICRLTNECVTVYDSPFQGLDESRDKNFLLDRIHSNISDSTLRGDPCSPYWVLALDGDEVLESKGQQIIRDTINTTIANSYSLQVKYLWNEETNVRVDGVYANFCRPSIFRVFNKTFKFMSTPWGNGANFHCASVPQELIHGFHKCPARLWHYGYLDKDLRRTKYDWYNKIDPDNAMEDCYRHIIQGDPDGASVDIKLRYAGPMKFETVEEF